MAKRMNADLIVMGTHGRTGFKRALIGSVAESVVPRAVSRAHCQPPPPVQKGVQNATLRA